MEFYVADLPPQAWIGFALFVVSGLWVVIGDLSLLGELKRRGIAVPFLLRGMTLLVYPMYRTKSDPTATDRLALSVFIALLVLLGTVYFLGPYMWHDGGLTHQ